MPISGRAAANVLSDPSSKNNAGRKQYELPLIHEMPRTDIVDHKTKIFDAIQSDNEEETKQNMQEYDLEDEYSNDFGDVQPSVKPA